MQLENAEAIRQVRLYTIHRREPRYVYTTPVTLRRFLRFGPVVTRAMCLDISHRGMSALVCGAPRVGETVVIELPLRDAPIEMLAMVRHSNDARSGFEFYPLSAPDEDALNQWIREQEKREEMMLPCPDIRPAGFGRGS